MPRGGKNYIPRPDDTFDAWLENYIAASVPWWSLHGGDGELDTLNDLRTVWLAAHAQHIAAQAAARAASQSKDEARAACEVEIRRLTRIVQAASDTTNAQRAAIGIALREGGTALQSRVPTSRPRTIIDISARLTHRLRLVDESAAHGSESRATKKARPRGVDRAEVFVALTEPMQPAPSDPRAYRYIGSVSSGQTTLTFESDKGGLQAHYLSRWIATSGAAGPWSEAASATVAA